MIQGAGRTAQRIHVTLQGDVPEAIEWNTLGMRRWLDARRISTSGVIGLGRFEPARLRRQAMRKLSENEDAQSAPDLDFDSPG